MAVEQGNVKTSKRQNAKTGGGQAAEAGKGQSAKSGQGRNDGTGEGQGAQTPEAEGITSVRRVAIGANVAIAIIAAAALLVAINWIISLKNYRRDLASLGNYGISERTKRVVGECRDNVHLSLLYRSDEKDDKQRHYIDRLLEYGEELARFSPKVAVTHVDSDSQRERLVARLSSAFGGEAEGHKKALASFEGVRSDLLADLQERIAAGQALLGEQSWLGDFPLFARVVKLLEQDLEQLNEASKEIAQLAPETGIPKYGEAATKAKEAVKAVKEDFGTLAKAMEQLTALADETTRPDSAPIAMLREVAREAKAKIDSLRQLIGAEGAPPPADVSAALKAYADRASEVGKSLDQLVARVDGFAQQFPMVEHHANWATQARVGGLPIRMEVGRVLMEAGAILQQLRLALLGVIDKGDPQQLEESLARVRKNTSNLESNAAVCEQILTSLADSLTNLDDASRQVLEAARGGNLLKDQVASLETLEKEFEALPELKMGTMADELKQDNIVVVETNNPAQPGAGKVRVVDFSSVWPVQESIGGRPQAGEEADRTFNGDSVISSAILALNADKPFARVVLVAFEPAPPQQQNPFMRPPQSSIPTRALTQVRSRLEAANFKVANWNLATEKEKPKPDEGEEDLNDIYVILPPTPPPGPNPFGGGPTPDQLFTDEHIQIVRDLLHAGGRAIFLVAWDVQSGPLGGGLTSPVYPYGKMLREDWGLDVRTDRRIVSVEPDLQSAYGFRVNAKEFQYLPVTGWTEQPIGRPMAGTRFFVLDASPIETAPEAPGGVSQETILKIPRRERFISTGIEEIVTIIDTIRDPNSDGRVEFAGPPRTGPFDLMVAATRDGKPAKPEGEAMEAGPTSQEAADVNSRIVVMAFGRGLVDEYLTQQVVVSFNPIRFEPPPTESLDLFVNALYWLNDQASYIGRGPVPVPRVYAVVGGELTTIRWFVWGIWPVLVFVPGVFLWYVRRR